jgi:myosin heavy subunit
MGANEVKEYERMKEENNKINSENCILKSDIDKIKNKNNTLKETNKKLIDDMNALKEETFTLKLENVTLREDNKRLKDDNDKLNRFKEDVDKTTRECAFQNQSASRTSLAQPYAMSSIQMESRNNDCFARAGFPAYPISPYLVQPSAPPAPYQHDQTYLKKYLNKMANSTWPLQLLMVILSCEQLR